MTDPHAELHRLIAALTLAEAADALGLLTRLPGLRERCSTWDAEAMGLTRTGAERFADAALFAAVRACAERR